jgi:tetratricopeptide (TPR) repeat protein
MLWNEGANRMKFSIAAGPSGAVQTAGLAGLGWFAGSTMKRQFFRRLAAQAPRLCLLAALLSTAGPAAAQTPVDALPEVQRLVALPDLPAALRAAEAALARLKAEGRQDARLVFTRGVILMDLQRDEQAEAVFRQMTQDYPQLAEPYNNLAALHARAGRWDAARSALEAALRNDPAHLLARENLGDVYLQLALQSWRAAVSAAQPNLDLQRKLRHGAALAQRPAPTP